MSFVATAPLRTPCVYLHRLRPLLIPLIATGCVTDDIGKKLGTMGMSKVSRTEQARSEAAGQEDTD